MADRRVPEHGWTCFHCGDTFRTYWDARDHFGFDESADPACRIKGGAEHGLLQRLRDAERALVEAWDIIHGESTDAMKAMQAQAGRHFRQLQNAEELGYERGLRDGLAMMPGERSKLYADAENEG